MTPKQQILVTLNRRPTDRTPVDLWHTPEISAAQRKHFEVRDNFAMWKALNLNKNVWGFLDCKTDAGAQAGGQSGAGAESGGSSNMWSVPLKNIQAVEASYAEFGIAPLTGYDTSTSIKKARRRSQTIAACHKMLAGLGVAKSQIAFDEF